MSAAEIQFVKPFYFKSYNRIIGVARNLDEFQKEFARLSLENPGALQYHLKQGHIVKWLNYSNVKELAAQLTGVESVEEARSRIVNYVPSRSAAVLGE